ncbi:hypothetical protein DFAR_2310004 [Desulfarculales bacterium]
MFQVSHAGNKRYNAEAETGSKARVTAKISPQMA